MSLSFIRKWSKAIIDEAVSVVNGVQQWNRDIQNVLNRMDSIGCDPVT